MRKQKEQTAVDQVAEAKAKIDADKTRRMQAAEKELAVVLEKYRVAIVAPIFSFDGQSAKPIGQADIRIIALE